MPAFQHELDLTWEGRLGLDLEKDLTWESRQILGLYKDVTWSNYLHLHKDLTWGASIRAELEKDLIWRSSTYSYAIRSGHRPLTGASRRRKFPGVMARLTDTNAGATRSLHSIKSLSIQKNRNQPLQWSIVLSNKSRDYSKYNNTSPFYGWLSPDIWSTTGTIARYLEIKIQLDDGDVWESPHLVIKSYTYSADLNGGFNVTISGTDLSEYLFQENITMKSQVSIPGQEPKTAHSITAFVLGALKVPSWSLQFKNFPVWKFHMQGQRPIDALERLWSVARAVWWWEGNHLVIADPVYKPAGPADYVYTTGQNVKSINLSESSNRLINSVHIVRDLDSQISNSEEGTAVGPLEIGISPPLFAFQWNIDTRFCYVVPGTVTLWDEDDEPWSGSNLKGVAKLKFFLQPQGPSNPLFGGPQAGDKPYWRVMYKGVSHNITLAGFDSYLSVRVKNQTSINTWGERRNPDPHEDPFIPNKEWARWIGEQLLIESGRKREALQLDAVFDPFPSPNQTMQVVDFHSGLDHYFYVEEMSFSLPELRTTLVGNKYLQ